MASGFQPTFFNEDFAGNPYNPVVKDVYANTNISHAPVLSYVKGTTISQPANEAFDQSTGQYELHNSIHLTSASEFEAQSDKAQIVDMKAHILDLQTNNRNLRERLDLLTKDALINTQAEVRTSANGSRDWSEDFKTYVDTLEQRISAIEDHLYQQPSMSSREAAATDDEEQ